MTKKIVRVVSRAPDGSIRSKDYAKPEDLTEIHEQIGIDDCSTDLSLRGFPLFRGLIGPMAESKGVALYESPDIFEFMTKEWSQIKNKRKRRTQQEIAAETSKNQEHTGARFLPPPPKMGMGFISNAQAVNS